MVITGIGLFFYFMFLGVVIIAFYFVIRLAVRHGMQDNMYDIQKSIENAVKSALREIEQNKGL